ncbi:MAG: hypothetical protein N2115_05765, partial [bacterium]|nr:hypothetical protein [bacterium]
MKKTIALLFIFLFFSISSELFSKNIWWQKIPAGIITKLDINSFDKSVSPGWSVSGLLKMVEDPQSGSVFLQADKDTEIVAGVPQWNQYSVISEIMLGEKGTATLSAANEQTQSGIVKGYQIELYGDRKNNALIYYSASSYAEDLITSTAGGVKRKQWLQLYLVPKEETEKFPGWQNSWVRLKIEILPQQARLWINGILISSVDFPERKTGGIRLFLPKGHKLKNLQVSAIPEDIAGYLPLDLSYQYNGKCFDTGDLGDGYSIDANTLPTSDEFIKIGGIPFFFSARADGRDNLDVSLVKRKPAYYGSANDPNSYFKASATNPSGTIMLRVPKRQYTHMAIIATCDTRTNFGTQLNIRMFKPGRGLCLDSVVNVPRWNEKQIPKDILPLTINFISKKQDSRQEQGNLYLVKVPLDPGAFQDFICNDSEIALELDITRPAERDGWPGIIAQPTAVHILAATLIESPVEMKLTSDETGHIFVQPQIPEMKFILSNKTLKPQKGTIDVKITDFYGKKKDYSVVYDLSPGQKKEKKLQIKTDVRGLHYIEATLKDKTGTSLIKRQTTFAVLPPDTRKADRDSPFGMWVFTTGHFGAGAEAAGSLMKKIGVRWSFGWEKIMMEKYNIYPAWLDIFSRRFEPPEKLVEYLKENPQYNFLCVFGETAFSETHFHYFPPELLENPAPRPLNEVEEQKFKQLWEKAITYSEIVRKEFPDKKLIFGNGYPQFIHTFMSRGYPKNLVDGFALDFIGYKMELFFYLKEVAKHYGYDNVPFYITEGFYLGTKQGYYHDRISEQKQADRYIQGFLHGFSLGVEKFLSSSEIWDNSSEYYFTGYGPVGLCHKPPELNPKIGYVAYATMTLLLDRAKFHSKVPAGYVKNDTGAEQFIESANVYALRFDKPEGCVYALWAGPERECTVSFIPSKGTKPYLVDSQSNEFPLTKKQEKLFFKVGSSPVWIVDAGEIQRFYVEETVFNASPGKTAQILVSGETFKDWKVDLQPYPEMEAMNENRPVKSVPDYFILGISGKSTTVRVGEIQNICPYRLLYTV